MNLTTTSYAVLGQLALRPWTMYDLATHMRRDMHYIFPRAESQVYAEPKRLVALGLASAQSEATGKRSRTIYSITQEGRTALQEWLAQPVAKGPQLEFEALLRVILAPLGRQEDLVATLQGVRAEVSDLLTLGERIVDEYTTGNAPFQRYALARSMLHDFLFAYAELIDDWAERSLQRIETWETQTPLERTAAAIDVYRRRSRRKRPALPLPPPHDFHGKGET
jgi:PadR family transcriptional regulator AphA